MKYFLLCLFLLPASTASAITTLFYDECTEATTDTNWESHTPNTGTSPTEASDTATGIDIKAVTATGVCGGVGTTADDSGELFVFNEVPTTVDYTIEWNAAALGGADNAVQCAVFRYVDTSNYYTACIHYATKATDMYLRKKVSDSWTTLASGDFDNTNGTCVRVVVTDAAKTVYTQAGCTGDWTQRLTTADNALTAKGKGGFCFGNCSGNSADDVRSSTPYADNIRLYEAGDEELNTLIRTQ